MPGQGVPIDLRAVILAEAAWIGDDSACDKYGITKRTLQRIRRRSGTDVALMQALEVKKRAFERRWLEDLDGTIGAAIRTVRVCAEEVAKDPRSAKNPAIIKELAGAVKLLADVKLANRVIDARLAAMQMDGGPVPESHQLGPGEVEIAPGVIITSPELSEVDEARGFTTETPSVIDLAVGEQEPDLP